MTSVRMNVNRETSNIKRTVISGTDETMNTNEQPVSRFTFDVSRLPIYEQIPWTNSGYYLSQRPSFTFDPLFHAGCYYVQEASSMFLEQPFRQLTDLSQPMKVLDLCGAPGGKSTHIQSLISADSLLVSNEVIKGRSHVLIDNIVKTRMWWSAVAKARLHVNRMIQIECLKFWEK